MKSRKLIGVYTGLLIIAVATMIMLWRLKTMPKAEVFPRDYPEIKEEGIPVLLVEQNAMMSLGICDRAYVLETGSIITQGTGKEMLENEEVKKAYLGL